ncbi:SurA N-terminal domain-containing protein [Phenylobacterium sp.]|uniref:peptidylprolyl isomerase n=1 Tax=Phenylobacterium sp. TaxID=1871053 RepID=UPI0039831A34
MLTAIRAFAKSWVAAVLIGLLIISFAVFGINDIFTGNAGDQVVKAGSRTLTSADFKREYDTYKTRFEQQAGQPITPEMASANGLDRRVLDGVATREAFAELLSRAGVRPSDKLLIAELQKIPAFFDQVSGRFDPKIYEQRLGENGLTPTKFDQVLRDEMAEQHLATSLVNGLRVPRAYSALGAIYAMESRDLAYFPVSPQSVPQPAPPTDAQLTAFMRENASQLTRPEFRVLTIVRFSPALVAGNLTVDEAELTKRYNFRKDTLSTPETRTVVQIPAKDQATAQRIGQRLAAGEAPAAVARASGVDALTYENKPQTAIPDRRVGAAAFQMQPGQVAPVQGDLGVAVVKVVSATPGRLVTLEQARPMLEAELRKDAAAERVYALTQAYEDAHQGGSDLAGSAQKAGVAATTIGPISQQGGDLQNQPVQGVTQKIVETAFALPAGGESDVTEAGNGEYFAVRVERIMPPAMPPLAEVRPQLTRVWMLREVVKRMQTRADELSARVRKGEALDAVAASTGASVVRVGAIDRQSASQNQQVSRDILGRAFAAKPGEVFTADNSQFGLVVARVEAVRAGSGSTLARMAEDSRPQMTLAIFREIGEAARTSARQTLKVKTDYARARAAIGLEPVQQPAEKGKAK